MKCMSRRTIHGKLIYLNPRYSAPNHAYRTSLDARSRDAPHLSSTRPYLNLSGLSLQMCDLRSNPIPGLSALRAAEEHEFKKRPCGHELLPQSTLSRTRKRLLEACACDRLRIPCSRYPG